MADPNCFTELQKTAFKIACEKGWWEEDRPNDELIALCHSEVSEALESWRNHEGAHFTKHDGTNPKPEGWGIELADVGIRIFDLAEKRGFDVGELVLDLIGETPRPHHTAWRSAQYNAKLETGGFSFTKGLCLLHRNLAMAELDQSFMPRHLAQTFVVLLSMAEQFGVDLEALTRVKMAYNYNRPYKHGGKKC